MQIMMMENKTKQYRDSVTPNKTNQLFERVKNICSSLVYISWH